MQIANTGPLIVVCQAPCWNFTLADKMLCRLARRPQSFQLIPLALPSLCANHTSLYFSVSWTHLACPHLRAFPLSGRLSFWLPARPTLSNAAERPTNFRIEQWSLGWGDADIIGHLDRQVWSQWLSWQKPNCRAWRKQRTVNKQRQ